MAAAPLVVSIPHSLGKAEALRRLKSGLDGLPQAGLLTLDQQAWTDNRLSFAVRALGQSVPGSLEVLDNSVRLEVVLPGLLLKLWEPLKTVLLGRAKLLLEKK
jgi:Putative polyhydroxyalkanoic acid system protein (PHA_gran_rgn)